MHGIIIFISVLSIIALIVTCFIGKIEEVVIFHRPSVCPRVGGKTIFPLRKSQSELIHWSAATTVVSENPKLLYLHGNGGCVAHDSEWLDKLESIGFDVWALEYPGYLASDSIFAQQNNVSFSRTLQTLPEAWIEMKGSDRDVIIGMSLGGVLLASTCDQLNPPPAQLVFMSTFPSLVELIAHHLKCNILSSCLNSHEWHAPIPSKYNGSVLVIYSEQDTVVPPKESKKFINEIFPHINVDSVIVQGDHAHAAKNNLGRWSQYLLAG